MRKPRTSVPSEIEFVVAATEAGWSPVKRGWPDFAMWHPEKGFAVVEVKSSGRCRLKAEQTEIMRALAAAGIKAYMWDPDRGFTKMDQ